MIHNEEQLELVQRQLGHLEAALQDLEDEVRPQSEKQFGLMSEIYVEHIARLRGEIDEYCAARPQPSKVTRGAKGDSRGRPAVRRPA